MEFRVLGPVGAHAGGRRVAPIGARQERILAALLLDAGRVVPVSRLVDVVWDDAPPATATRQIRNVTTGLRRLLVDAGLPPDALAAVGPGFVLTPPRFDLRDFDDHLARGEYAAALACWRGRALEGIDSPALTGAAAALDERRLGAMHLHLTDRVAAGEDVVADLTALVAEHPLAEGFAALLIRALRQQGRQAEALAVYQDARRRLVDDLGVEPGGELRAAHEQVLREPPTGPCCLPGEPPDFTGRDTELADVVAALHRGAPVVIGGMAGVGKTALAVRAAHRVADEYADGQLFIDLHAHTPGRDRLGAGDALAGLLWQLGVPGSHQPPGVDERAALWRARTAGRKLLVLLDNAADTAQVIPLLPATPTVAVLITSRRRLTDLDGATPLPLTPLPDADSSALFTAISGHPDAGIARLCGNLPLAIRIAAARLRQRPQWTASDLATRLGGEQARLDGKRTRLASEHTSQHAQRGDQHARLDSHTHLSDEHNRPDSEHAHLSGEHDQLDSEHDRLGEHDRFGKRDRLTGEHAHLDGQDAHLGGQHPHLGGEHARLGGERDRLGELRAGGRSVAAAFHLSYRELDPAQQRMFRLLGTHPGGVITARAAAALADVPDAQPLLEDLVDAHLLDPVDAHTYRMHDLLAEHARQLADSETTPGFTRLLDYYRAGGDAHWHATERPALRAIVERAADDHAEAAWQVADHAAPHVRGHPDFLAIARAARHTGDPAALHRALGHLADAHWDSGDLPAALDCTRARLRITTHSPTATAEALSRLGALHAMSGQYQSSVDCYERALTLADTDPETMALLLGNLSHSQEMLGHLPAALHSARRSRALADTSTRTALSTAQEALILARLGDHRTAQHLAESAVDTAATLSHPFTTAWTHTDCAEVMLLAGNPSRARTHADEACTTLTTHPHPLLLSMAANTLGAACLHTDDPTAALTHHRLAHTTAQRIGYHFQTKRAAVGMAQAKAALAS